MSLERILAIERELKSGLLKENYDGLTEKNGQRCTELVVEYLHSVERASGNSLIFIKLLTKVGYHIMASGHVLDDVLEMLYDFNILGAHMAQQNRGTLLTPRNLIMMESHFFSYAGDTAQKLFEQTQDVLWLQKWYECKERSGDLSLNIEPRHSAYVYGFAGDAARLLFEATGDISWAQKWYKSYTISAELSKKAEPRHSAYAYCFAGDAAHTLFELTKDILWLQRWHECYAISAEMTKETEQRHSAYAYCFAGDAAKLLYGITENTQWRDAAIRCYASFLNYFKINPERAMHGVVNRVERIIVSFAS